MHARRKVIVGLGNPGKEFAHTYHNVGVLALQACAGTDAHAFKPYKKLFSSATTGNRVLVIPHTFMNDSGKAVRAAIKKFDGQSEDLMVIHDDSDLALGAYKISSDKNSAGHHGVQSIINALGTKDFTRIRIGIRPQAEQQRAKASSFVLKKISPKDKKVLEGVFKKIAEEIRARALGSIDESH